MAASSSVDNYVSNLEGAHAEITVSLRSIIQDAIPEAEEAIKWGHPTWSLGGPVCQIKPAKKQVGLVFWWGAKLNDPQGLLSGMGSKMRTVKFGLEDTIDAEAIRALVLEAVRANSELGDPTKNKA